MGTRVLEARVGPETAKRIMLIIKSKAMAKRIRSKAVPRIMRNNEANEASSI